MIKSESSRSADWISRCVSGIEEICNDLPGDEAWCMARSAYEQCDGVLDPVKAAQIATDWGGWVPHRRRAEELTASDL